MKNYIEIKNKIPFRKSFMYIDVDKYLADNIFIDHELYWVVFKKKELRCTDSNFIISYCSILSKDEDKFIECMEHLNRKIEFFDYDMDDYEFLCSIFKVAEDLHNKGELK